MSSNPIQPLAEFNNSRMGLIASQSKQLSGKFRTGWRASGPNGSEIICIGTEQYGIPQGIANDLFCGINTALVANRTPDNRNPTLNLTLAEILKLSGLNPQKHHYTAAEQMLNAMRTTTYELKNCWQMPVLGISIKERASFRLIGSIVETEIENFNANQKIRRLRIKLDDIIADSLDGPHMLCLNTEIIKQLSSPTSRSLYRLLDSLRRDLFDPNRVQERISLPLKEFLDAMRVLSTSQHISEQAKTLIRKGGPLEQLKQVGYLKGFEIIGRGDASIIHFQFSNTNTVLDKRGVQLLVSIGVATESAESLSEAHSLEEIECALWLMETKAEPLTNPPGFVIQMLKTETAKNSLPRFRKRSQKKQVRAEQKNTLAKPATKSATSTGTQNDSVDDEPIILNLEETIQMLLGTGKIKPAQVEICEELVRSHRVTLSELAKLAFEARADVPAKLAEFEKREPNEKIIDMPSD